jgi:xanthosine utilization system XapX-like protein
MFVILILATGIAVGILPGLLRLDKMFSPTNMVVGCVGALVGVFLGFGDVPLFLEYSFLNEITLMVAISLLFVSIKVSITRKPKVP